MTRALLIALAGLSYLLVLGPILIVIVTAFSPTEFFVFPPPISLKNNRSDSPNTIAGKISGARKRL